MEGSTPSFCRLYSNLDLCLEGQTHRYMELNRKSRGRVTKYGQLIFSSFLSNFSFIMEYSWFTVLYQCQGTAKWFSFTHPGDSNGRESACSAENPGLIPGLERSPGEGNGYPLQYSCLENSMDRGASGAIVHGLQRVGYNWMTFTESRYPLLFQILFPYRLLQNIEQISLCCIVGPCWWSVLYILVSVY